MKSPFPGRGEQGPERVGPIWSPGRVPMAPGHLPRPPAPTPAPTLCISKGVGGSSSRISSGEARPSRPLRQGRRPGLPSRATLCTVPVMMDACGDTTRHSDAHSVSVSCFGHLLCARLPVGRSPGAVLASWGSKDRSVPQVTRRITIDPELALTLCWARF